MRGSNGLSELLVASTVMAPAMSAIVARCRARTQRIGQKRRADLRAVDERQAFLGLQLVRRQVHPPQGRSAADRLAARRAGIDIGARLADEGMPLADNDERQVGERRQIAAGADAALLRNRRHDAAVVDAP